MQTQPPSFATTLTVFISIIALYHTTTTALIRLTRRLRITAHPDTSHLATTVSMTVQPSVNIVALLCCLQSNSELHLPNDTLVLDSGASHHMVKDASLFDTWHTRSHVAVDGAGES